MKNSILSLLKLIVVTFFVFLVTNYYIGNVARQTGFFEGVFIPEAIQSFESKVFEDPHKDFQSYGFYIKIPRIGLFKSVVKDVDPRYKEAYVESWQHGVSHGRFTAYPDQIGNTYFFAHSVNNESKVTEENAWFTRLTQVELDDFVFVYYEGIEYKYQVISIIEVDPSATGVYTGIAPIQKITLQTCPNGSLSSRLIVEALLVGTDEVSKMSKDEIYSYDEISAL